jgi:hypothetical protein
MKHTLTLLLFALNFIGLRAEEDIPTINKMWSRSEGIRNFVFDIEPDSMSFNFSEKDKWSASNIKSYGIISFDQIDNNGRLIVKRDSLGIEHFRAIDVMNLTLDSIKLYLHPQYFAEKGQADAAPKIKPTDYKTFFTTEYLYLKKVEEKAPSLKKNDYISFLKDAQAEAKKRAVAKTLNMDPKKPIDKRVEEFLFAFAKDKKYRGKIFPNNLEKAMKANAKDENIKKMMAGLKTNFVVKKGTEATDPKQTKGKEGTKNVDKKVATKEKSSNDLIIQTEDKKSK